MVRRRSKLKQAEEDAMSRLTAVRWKFQEDELRVEELTIATNLLIEAADHRVLYQLLTLLLEWVHSAPFPPALVSSAVLVRLVTLLNCPAWPIQKAALQLLTACAINLQSEDATHFAKLLMPPAHKFFNYISNPIHCWPDNTQHMVLAQLVFTIVCPHPLLTPDSHSTPTALPKASASTKNTKRSKPHNTNTERQVGKSDADSNPTTERTSASGPQSLCLAWDIVHTTLLRHQGTSASSMYQQTDPFQEIPTSSCFAAPHLVVDSIQPVNCYGCNLIDDTSLAALQSSCSGDPDDSATFFALQTLQYLLRHTWFSAHVFAENTDVIPVVLHSLNSSCTYVVAAAAATMCSLITKAPVASAPVTCSMQLVWRVRVLSDRCVQPDQVALNALPLIHHIAHVYPAQMCSSGLVSVITKSIHAMNECMKSTALQYLMLAFQILMEVLFFPEPLSVSALRGDVLGAALKAVKLTWHADQVYSHTGDRVEDNKIVSSFLQHVRLDAIQCVHMIRSMCNLRDRPAMLDRILQPMEREQSESGGRPQDLSEEPRDTARSTGHQSNRSSNRDSSGSGEGGWCKAGALYMGLLWQAERNFSGAISVERALAQGEGQLVGGGLEDKPFIISAFERI